MENCFEQSKKTISATWAKKAIVELFFEEQENEKSFLASTFILAKKHLCVSL